MSKSTSPKRPHVRRHRPALEATWRKTLARWRASRLSVSSYCQRQGLSEARFYYWRNELAGQKGDRRGGEAAGAAEFVELHASPTANRPAVMDGCPLELLLPEGPRLLIRRDCDSPLLRTVLEVLRQEREERSC